jgi:hypothetical protein
MNRLGLTVAAVVLSLPMLTACAKSESADNGRVPVAIYGVNHTDDEFSFVLADPLDKENRAGGETINAYGAGGTMCCFNLPKQWRPGLKAEVRATMWLPPTPQNNLPSVTKSYLLDIPAYAPGKAGELWILRTAADEFSLVSSNFQPDHPNWPGKVKGWPVPSLEYQRVIHASFLKEAQSDVDLSESSLEDLKNRPIEHGREMWEHRMVREANALKAYKGPEDVAFIASLRAEYQAGLVHARERLKQVKAAQP